MLEKSIEDVCRQLSHNRVGVMMDSRASHLRPVTNEQEWDGSPLTISTKDRSPSHARHPVQRLGDVPMYRSTTFRPSATFLLQQSSASPSRPQSFPRDDLGPLEFAPQSGGTLSSPSQSLPQMIRKISTPSLHSEVCSAAHAVPRSQPLALAIVIQMRLQQHQFFAEQAALRAAIERDQDEGFRFLIQHFHVDFASRPSPSRCTANAETNTYESDDNVFNHFTFPRAPTRPLSVDRSVETACPFPTLREPSATTDAATNTADFVPGPPRVVELVPGRDAATSNASVEVNPSICEEVLTIRDCDNELAAIHEEAHRRLALQQSIPKQVPEAPFPSGNFDLTAPPVQRYRVINNGEPDIVSILPFEVLEPRSRPSVHALLTPPTNHPVANDLPQEQRFTPQQYQRSAPSESSTPKLRCFGATHSPLYHK